MAYGFALKNELGEDILDERETLYIQDSGSTVNLEDAGLHILNETTGTMSYYDYGPLRNPEVLSGRIVSDGIGSNIPESRGPGYPVARRAPTPLWPKTSMAFYRPDPANGLSCSIEMYFGPTYSTDATPSQGLSFWSRSGLTTAGDGGALEYFIADTSLGPVAPTYKFELRNAANKVIFDSRAGLFSVAQVLNVTKAEVDSIIYNNATYDIQLSKPMPGCYICIPYLSAFQYYRSSGNNPNVSHFRPRIRQVADDLLRIDRVQIGPDFRYTDAAPSYTHDFWIFVARDPFA